MIGDPPLVSVGIPVYNGEDFLREAIDSVLAQTLTDFELVISDNGSVDGTQKICEEFARQTPLVRYFRQDKNRGAAWNYNEVFRLSRGKYFKWAAHDDLLEPRFLERCVKRLENDEDVVLCYAKSALIGEDGEFLRNVDDGFERLQQHPHERLLGFDPRLCHPVFGVMRRSALVRTDLIGAYPDSDRTLLWQMLLAGKAAEQVDVLFLRRTHPGSSVRANPDNKRRMNWFDPNRKLLLYLPTWYHFFKFSKSILKADIDASQKAHCLAPLAKMFLARPWWMIADFPFAILDAMGVSPLLWKDIDWI